MIYPPSPWTLQGFSLQTLHLLDVSQIRSFIPADLKILSVLPGKTLGGVYIASYHEGSTLCYNELIVVSGLIDQAGKIGGWISHIYVDHPDSIAGGRKIWGLPKQMAEFTWNMTKNPSVQVQHAGRSLCTLRCQWRLPGWQQSLAIPMFSLLNQKLLHFQGRANFSLHLAGLDLTLPSDSPLKEIGLGQAWLGAYADPLRCVVESPRFISQKGCYCVSSYRG